MEFYVGVFETFGMHCFFLLRWVTEGMHFEQGGHFLVNFVLVFSVLYNAGSFVPNATLRNNSVVQEHCS